MNLAALSLCLLLLSLSITLHTIFSTPRSSSPLGSTAAFSRPDQPPWHHPQVFINFRGEELRYGFLSHLGEGLKRREVNFFIDKHEERGKDLKSLFKRIDESAMALVIFSPRYAESAWCLDELVRIMERLKLGKLRMIPIFYKVEPSDVREQKGEFGDKFWELAKTSPRKIKKWTDALHSATNKMGLTLADKSYENDFINEIVKEVERALSAISTKKIQNPCGRNGQQAPCKFRRTRKAGKIHAL